MSYVAVTDNINDKILFKEFIDILGAEIIGDQLMSKYGTWPMFAKLFDFSEPLFHHVHLTKAVGRIWWGKRVNRKAITFRLNSIIIWG
jgi:hypothetical protein